MIYKKRRIKFVFCLFMSVTMLAGCGNEKVPTGVTDLNPEHFYEEVQDNILIDADVIGAEADIVPQVYEVKQLDLKKERIEKFLALQNDRIIEEKYNSTYVSEQMFAESEKGKSIYMTFSKREDFLGNEFQYYGGDEGWYDELYVFRTGGALGENNDANTPFEFFSNNDSLYRNVKKFAFADVEEAEAAVYRSLESLDMRDLILTDTFYLDHELMAQAEHETMSAVEKAIDDGEYELSVDENGEPITYVPKESWTEADDCYVFIFRNGVDGVETTHELFEEETVYQWPTYVEVLYGVNGILYMEASNAFNLNGIVEEPESIISASKALAVAKEKVTNVIMKDKRVITQIALRYLQMQDSKRWILKPVWEITVCRKQTGWDGKPWNEYSYIWVDAITGKEI